MRMSFSSLTALTVWLHAPMLDAQAAPTATVRVDVATFKNTKGTLGCQIFSQAKSKGFPEDGALAFARRRASINGKMGQCTFGNLPPGVYAVGVLHDEDNDGKVNKSLFGAPTEGYGVSNNHTYAMKAPKWEESKFVLAAGETKLVKINLRY